MPSSEERRALLGSDQTRDPYALACGHEPEWGDPVCTTCLLPVHQHDDGTWVHGDDETRCHPDHDTPVARPVHPGDLPWSDTLGVPDDH